MPKVEALVAKSTTKDNILLWLFGIGVSLCCFGGAVFGVPWLIGRYLGFDPLTDDEIRDGRACAATVLSIKDKNSTINRDEVFEFRLQVNPADGAPYEASVTEPVGVLQASSVKADGTRYRCVIARDDPDRVKVFWSEATRTP